MTRRTFIPAFIAALFTPKVLAEIKPKEIGFEESNELYLQWLERQKLHVVTEICNEYGEPMTVIYRYE